MGQKPPLVVLAFSGWKEYHWQFPANFDPGELHIKQSSNLYALHAPFAGQKKNVLGTYGLPLQGINLGATN